jgi:hypothetical protein
MLCRELKKFDLFHSTECGSTSISPVSNACHWSLATFLPSSNSVCHSSWPPLESVSSSEGSSSSGLVSLTSSLRFSSGSSFFPFAAFSSSTRQLHSGSRSHLASRDCTLEPYKYLLAEYLGELSVDYACK